ncbi:MAG: PEP/pyruvate-binding domain-containing protein [Candidatus Cloacimonadaceae bacterium]
MDTLSSKALTANLELTKVQQIELDAQALRLLELCKSHFGIHQRVELFLKELYHPFVNPLDSLGMMRQSLLGDLWFFAALAEANEAVQIIISLYDKARSYCEKEECRKKLINDYLELGLSLCDYPTLSPDVFGNYLEILISWHAELKDSFIRLGSLSRKALLKLATLCPQPEACLGFLRKLLLDNLLFWQSTAELGTWHEILPTHAPNYEYYQAFIDQLESIDLGSVPTFSEIANQHRYLIGEIQAPSQRVHYIFFLLSLPGMQELMDHLLWDLNRQLFDLHSLLEEEELNEIISSVFVTLAEFKKSHPSIVLDCLGTISKAILKCDKEESKRLLIRKISKFGFTPPGEVKIAGDWQMVVDKSHVKHLRILLELIAINPKQNKDLLAFTVLNITRHGIFIADTDLFQKDVSSYLNADIASVFVQSKHLLRMFPVFYHEIGAEGEIRDASTTMDEMSQRKDRLIHFLRKQIHTESNNTHITLTERILRYWVDLNPSPLMPMIPRDVWAYLQEKNPRDLEQSRFVNDFLKEHQLTDTQLLALSWQRVEVLFAKTPDTFYLKRLKLLSFCHFLLKDKYNLDPHDIVKFLSPYGFFNSKEHNRLSTSLARRDYESSIRQMLSFIGILNATILDPKTTDATENIYYKRHIAAGIPSMYGIYKEPKLEALGMVFRLENVIGKLFERSIGQLNLEYINGKMLKRIIRILELYDFAMKQEMITSDAFGSALSMLATMQYRTTVSINQYLDIFKLLKDSVSEIISEYYYRFYDSALHLAFINDDNITAKEIFAEEFYRNLLYKSFIVQGLDGFISRILDALARMKVLFRPHELQKLMAYDPDTLFYHLSSKNARIENQVLLGSKAFFLKRMIQYEFPIPPGFVLTTDLYRNRGIINTHPDISAEFDRLLKDNLQRMENNTGLRYGDPEKPLLLSVRSGAPMSLPGAMDTFLNIGLTDEVTQRLSERANYGWTAWDCYRRLIQSWGMAYGIARDDFDKVMIDFKQRYHVQQKTQFSPKQMREMVQEYKNILDANKIHLEQDPFRQLYISIGHVLDSWNTRRAKLYREKLHIAEEWGTAVIIQKMVMGNISLNSGSGVLFTYTDWNRDEGICLNGDFTLCSQGEDVVAGLVHTLPISEAQRLEEHTDQEISLEKDFPAIYNKLLRLAQQLIYERNYPHQEIEFTFEGPSEDLLYILQTRNQVIHKSPDYKVLGCDDCEMIPLGTGIGIGKGAINGILVISQADIKKYKDGGEALILVRPDTVPDDMPLLFECQGLLTSRGGVTSHAAVTATRLGLIGVVNCRELVVDENSSTCSIGETQLKAGDKIALDAIGGAIYLGHYPLQSAHSLM